MPSNHSKREDDEEALQPEDDVIEEVHLGLKHITITNLLTFLVIATILNHQKDHQNDHQKDHHHHNQNDHHLQAPKKLKAGQKEGDCHDTAKDEPAFLPDHDDDDDDDDHDDDGDDNDAKYLRS